MKNPNLSNLEKEQPIVRTIVEWLKEEKLDLLDSMSLINPRSQEDFHKLSNRLGKIKQLSDTIEMLSISNENEHGKNN